jgi:hypothetical protein
LLVTIYTKAKGKCKETYFMCSTNPQTSQSCDAKDSVFCVIFELIYCITLYTCTGTDKTEAKQILLCIMLLLCVYLYRWRFFCNLIYSCIYKKLCFDLEILEKLISGKKSCRVKSRIRRVVCFEVEFFIYVGTTDFPERRGEWPGIHYLLKDFDYRSCCRRPLKGQ